MAYMAVGYGRARFGRVSAYPTLPMLGKRTVLQQKRPSAIAYDTYQ
jgi:hypothetical protein